MWSVISHQVKKTQQRLYFLRKLKQALLPQQLLVHFYCAIIESLQSYCCTVWYVSCTVEDWSDLPWVVKAAQHVTRTRLPPLEDIYTGWLQNNNHKRPNPPWPCPFAPLPPGRRYRTMKSKTNRLKDFLPRTVTSVYLPLLKTEEDWLLCAITPLTPPPPPTHTTHFVDLLKTHITHVALLHISLVINHSILWVTLSVYILLSFIYFLFAFKEEEKQIPKNNDNEDLIWSKGVSPQSFSDRCFTVTNN